MKMLTRTKSHQGEMEDEWTSVAWRPLGALLVARFHLEDLYMTEALHRNTDLPAISLQFRRVKGILVWVQAR